MAMTIASAHLNDDEFLEAMQNCELPLSCSRHGDHLRLAWLYLHRQPFEEALKSSRDAIRQFAAFHGVSHIFHETRTEAWVILLQTHTEETCAEFIERNDSRISRNLLHQFWTSTCLESDAARDAWVPPDRSPLPICGRERPFLP